MWEKKLEEYQRLNAIVYENDDASQAPIIKGLFIQTQNVSVSGKARLELKFTNPQKSMDFHEKFTRLCPSFTSPY